MKTILVATDFSLAANNAARYALRLAKALNANIKLCNAFKVPAETPIAAQVAWPVEDFASLKNEITEELRLFTDILKLDESTGPQSVHTLIEYTSQVGPVTDVVRNLVEDQKLPMVVMGMSGAGMVTRVLLGSSSRDMIEKASFPVLLIPSTVEYKGIQKIAFATDLSRADIDVVQSLAGLAFPFNAEIVLAHVTNEKYDDQHHQHKVDSFLNDITCKIDYPKIYYRHIKSMDVDSGLDWLTEHGQIDMLAIVHRRLNVFHRIFTSRHTQKLAKHIELPLLVFPAGYCSII